MESGSLTPSQTQNSKLNNQVVGEPVDTAFYSPDNPALAVPSSTLHPLAQLLPPEALRPAAANGRPFVLLSIFKVHCCHLILPLPPYIVTRTVCG